MSDELKVLALLHQRLEDNDIAYMITGSIAANFYTIPRMTRDIDIVIELKITDVDKVVKAFEKDFYVDMHMITEAIHEHGMFNMIHNETLVKIDFIVRKAEAYRQEEFNRRRQITIAGSKMWILSVEDLILSKLYWAQDNLSERQLNDVQNLLNSAQTRDVTYLEKWISNLGLAAVYNRVKS